MIFILIIVFFHNNIVINIVPSFSRPDPAGTFRFQNTLQIIVVVEIVVIFCLVVFFVGRLYFYFKEREIIRFTLGILNLVSHVGCAVAVGRMAPSTLILIFWAIMLIREIVSFFVGVAFYKKVLPVSRRKVLTNLGVLSYTILYIALLASGVVKITLLGTSFTGLF